MTTPTLLEPFGTCGSHCIDGRDEIVLRLTPPSDPRGVYSDAISSSLSENRLKSVCIWREEWKVKSEQPHNNVINEQTFPPLYQLFNCYSLRFTLRSSKWAKRPSLSLGCLWRWEFAMRQSRRRFFTLNDGKRASDFNISKIQLCKHHIIISQDEHRHSMFNYSQQKWHTALIIILPSMH